MEKTDDNINSLYIMSEKRANAFNLKCLAVLCVLAVATEVLNELGVFKVPLYILRPSILISFVFFSVPIMIYFVWDRLMKRSLHFTKTVF